MSNIREALENLVHLHMCEQEGLQSGQPTREDWLKAVDAASEALESQGEAKQGMKSKETAIQVLRNHFGYEDEEYLKQYPLIWLSLLEAMEEYANQFRVVEEKKSMKWVKANEIKPEEGWHSGKYGGDECVIDVNNGDISVTYPNGKLDYNPRLDLLLWLDESGVVEEKKVEKVEGDDFDVYSKPDFKTHKIKFENENTDLVASVHQDSIVQGDAPVMVQNTIEQIGELLNEYREFVLRTGLSDRKNVQDWWKLKAGNKKGE